VVEFVDLSRLCDSVWASLCKNANLSGGIFHWLQNKRV